MFPGEFGTVPRDGMIRKKGDNWTEDWGHNFDNKHFADNKVDTLFPDQFLQVDEKDNVIMQFCCPFLINFNDL